LTGNTPLRPWSAGPFDASQPCEPYDPRVGHWAFVRINFADVQIMSAAVAVVQHTIVKPAQSTTQP